MPRGLKRLTNAASTQAAWRDWHALKSWARANGHGEAARFHAPKSGAGHKTVDKQIEQLRVALGAPEGPWGNDVLAGLVPTPQQLPPGVRPTPEKALASGDLKANEDLHQLSGGKAVQQAADEWATQIQTPAEQENRQQGQREQQPQPEHEPPVDDDPFGAEGLTVEQRMLNVAQSVMRHTEVKRSSNGRGRCRTYAGNVDQIARSARHLAEDVTAYLQQRQMSPEQQYEHHLRQAAALRYPQEQRTAALTARIEATIRRRVADFTAECQARQQQAQQQELPPPQKDRGRSMEQSL